MKDAMKNLLLVCAVFGLGWGVNKYFTDKENIEMKVQIRILQENLTDAQKSNNKLLSKIDSNDSNYQIIQQISDLRSLKKQTDVNMIICATKKICESGGGLTILSDKTENIELAIDSFKKQSNDFQAQIETLLGKIN